MKRDKVGIQIFDETGTPILEVGPHIIHELPIFSEKIGAIAASWSHAEANLNCFFAILLDTTPEEAGNYLRKYRTAASATVGARRVAKETLSGSELAAVITILDDLDKVRARRNRVQHDVWAKKGRDDHRIFSIHSDQYLSFVTAVMAIGQSTATQSEKSGRVIELANGFAAGVSNGYSVEELDQIGRDIDILSKSLVSVVFSRISRRLGKAN
jgi:hypothetical protein